MNGERRAQRLRKHCLMLVMALVMATGVAGCLVDVTSVVAPISTTTGRVITFTVNLSATSDGVARAPGIILQIPSGTTVLRVHGVTTTSQSAFFNEDASITAGYTAESGYHLFGAVAPGGQDNNTTATLKVWLSVPNGVTPGIYAIKAAVGGKDGTTWVAQNPQAGGVPVKNFALISGKYASNPITIAGGGPDATVPPNIEPVVTQNGENGPFKIDISAYNEATQGDIVKYRVYVAKMPGTFSTIGATPATVTGAGSNSPTFAADIPATGTFFFEVPPGAEFPIIMSGLSFRVNYLIGMTAVDLAGHESGVGNPKLRMLTWTRYVSSTGTAVDACTNSSQPCGTIQHALDMSGDLDMIKVAPGVYNENLVLAKPIAGLLMSGGWGFTLFNLRNGGSSVIDGGGTGRVFVINGTSSDISLTIEDLTLRNGHGVLLVGGGLDAWSENGHTMSLTLRNNIIAGNTTTGPGGGVHISSTTGGTANLLMTNNTVTGNTASSGGGLYLSSLSAGITSVTLRNNIVWGNTATSGSDIFIDENDASGNSTTTVTVSFSDIGGVQKNGLTGTYTNAGNNVNSNPRFVDPTAGDYHLRGGSPAINSAVCSEWVNIPILGGWFFARRAPEDDIEADQRPNLPAVPCCGFQTGCDMGADEFTGSMPGVFRGGTWVIDFNDSVSWNPAIDKVFAFGHPTDKPVTGDWNGDGVTKAGVFRVGQWALDFDGSRSWNAAADKLYTFGLPTDIPVTGKWGFGGFTKIGVFRAGLWILDGNGDGKWSGCGGGVFFGDGCFTFGLPTDVPVTGDWSGTRQTRIGVFRSGSWYLDFNGNGVWDGCAVDRCYTFGLPTDVPVTGDWNGDGITEIGVFRNGTWVLDMNGNGAWNGAAVDKMGTFGLATDKPVSGTW